MLLVDFTSVIFSAWFANKEHEDWERYKESLKYFHSTILSDNRDNDVFLFGDAGKTFRHTLFPDYKANRIPMYRRFLPDLTQYAKDELGLITVAGLEADDLVGIYSTEYPLATICHIDKDLNQLPGKHYNYAYRRNNTDPWYDVSYEESWLNLYKQVTHGDFSVDGIVGIPGVGKETTKKLYSNVDEVLGLSLLPWLYLNGIKKGDELHKELKLKKEVKISKTLGLNVAEFYKNFTECYVLRSLEEAKSYGIDVEIKKLISF